LCTNGLAQTTVVKRGLGAMITDMGDYALYIGTGLMRTDGTTAGTTEIKPLAYMDCLTRVGDKLYFLAADTTAGTGQEVWVSDGTTKGTKPVTAIVAKGVRGKITSLVAVGGRLVFSFDDGQNGREPWAVDPARTTPIAYMIKNIRSLGSGLYSVNPRREFTVVGSQAYFAADNGTNGGEVWVTNGSQGNASMVADIYPKKSSSGPGNMASFGGSLWFSAKDDKEGNELWSAGSAGVKRYDLHPGKDLLNRPNNSNPKGFIATKSKLFFQATDANGTGLFVTDGSTAPKKIYNGLTLGLPPNNGLPNAGVPFGDGIVFHGNDGSSGGEPWFSNGTAAKTYRLADISASNSYPREFVNFLDRYVLFAANGNAGEELYITDGTTNPNATRLVEDIWPGFQHSLPRWSTVVKLPGCTRLLFFAKTAAALGGSALRSYRPGAPEPVTVRLSFKRITDREGKSPAFWNNGKINQWVGEVSEVWKRNANISFEAVEIVNLVDPGHPSSWANVQATRKKEYEGAIENDPCRYKWRTDAINIYLVTSIPGASAFCSFAACPADDNDIIVLSPTTVNGSMDLAHELGHYFNLLHTHAKYDPPMCGCNGSHGGDCVEDTPVDADPRICQNSADPLGCHYRRLQALRYPKALEDLLRYNLMSYHGPITSKDGGLSCGQVDRAHKALQTFRKHVIKGEKVAQISAVSPFGPLYPGPTSLVMSGQNFPQTTSLSVHVGDETTTNTSSNGNDKVGANFKQRITPGRHCASLLLRGNVIAYRQNAMEITPWMDWTVKPGRTTGSLTLEIKSTAPNATMFLGFGMQQLKPPGIFFPGVTYALRMQPTTVVAISTNQSASFRVVESMPRIPRNLRAVVQALELKNGFGMAFTNPLLITLP